MRPGIQGEAPFSGSPTPVLCPGCGDRLFSIEPGILKCELCGAEIKVSKEKSAELEDGWGGPDEIVEPARPARPTRVITRQHRKTGALAF
jgi:predicted amidophosphoribosyltransferase